MSFVTNMMFLNMATANRINANASIMNINQKQQNLAFKGNYNDISSIHKADKELTLQRLMDQTMAKIAETWEEALQKKQDKDIKKQFNTFA